MSETTMNPGAEPRISPWGAVLRVLTDPAQTFRSMADKPPVLAPYLVHMVAGAVFGILAFRPTMELALLGQQQALAAMPQGAEMNMEFMTTVTQWTTALSLAASALIAPWISGLVISLVATFFGRLQGGGVPLSSYMGMIGYARMPLAISTLLTGIFMAITGQTLNLTPAAFLPEGAPPVLVGLLGSLNPLNLWYYVLLAIGFAALHGREPRKGWPLPVTLFVITTLFTTVSLVMNAALMSM